MLPNFGMETIHHVHAEDVARLFTLAVTHKENALGEKFYAVSGGSITLYGYACLLYRHYGMEPKIDFLRGANGRNTSVRSVLPMQHARK